MNKAACIQTGDLLTTYEVQIDDTPVLSTINRDHAILFANTYNTYSDLNLTFEQLTQFYHGALNLEATLLKQHQIAPSQKALRTIKLAQIVSSALLSVRERSKS